MSLSYCMTCLSQRLELLDLSSNQLTGSAIKPGIFHGLNELQDVLLTNNKLTSIADGIFSGEYLIKLKSEVLTIKSAL